MTMSDRVAVFNEGKIAQIDRPETIYNRPATRFVANFLGETNVLEGVLVSFTDNLARIRLAETGTVHEAFCADPGLTTGDAAALAIRPENLRLATPGEAAIQASVVDSIFHGAHCKLRLVMTNGCELSMTYNPGSLGQAPPLPGESVRLALPSALAMVLR